MEHIELTSGKQRATVKEISEPMSPMGIGKEWIVTFLANNHIRYDTPLQQPQTRSINHDTQHIANTPNS